MNATANINILTANSVVAVYKQVRYGMKSCTPRVELELAFDLKIIHARSAERMACTPTDAEALHLAQIEEKINTL